MTKKCIQDEDSNIEDSQSGKSEHSCDSDSHSNKAQNSPCASIFLIENIVSDTDSDSASVFIVENIVSGSDSEEMPTSKTITHGKHLKRPTSKTTTHGNHLKRPMSKTTTHGRRLAKKNLNKVCMNKKTKVSNGDGQSVRKVNEKGGEIEEEEKSVMKWSEKDEDVLLGGIIDYMAKTDDVVVKSNMDVFHECVKDLFSTNITKSQVHEKIKRLKKKFRTNAEKLKNDREHVFLRLHEEKLFKLSQNIWGSMEGNDDKVKSSNKLDKNDGNKQTESVANKDKGKDAAKEDEKEETRDYWSLYPLLCASLQSEVYGHLTQKTLDLKEQVKKTISIIGKEKATELEDEWKSIYVMGVQLYAKRKDIINKQAQAVMDSLDFV